MTAHAPEMNEKLLNVVVEELRNHLLGDDTGRVRSTSLAIDILRAIASVGFIISEKNDAPEDA